MAVDDSYTVSLLHFDNNLNDESGKTWTAYGGVTTSNAQSKFGGYSAYFDGVNDYLTTPDSADFALGNAFSLDMWLYPLSITGLHCLFSQETNTDNRIQINIEDTGKIDYGVKTAGSWVYRDTTNSLSVNAMSHVYIGSNGTNVFIAINGNVETFSASNWPDLTGVLTIGKAFATPYYYYGYIDELRVSKGVARWTSNFTPPTVAYGSAPLRLAQVF